MKGRINILCISFIFIICLVFSTKVVLTLRGLYIEEIDYITVAEYNNDITSSIYYVTISDNVDGEVEIAGYAYMETDEDNSDKKIDIILQSGSHTYSIPTLLGQRPDLSAAVTGKMIQGMNHSFSGRFSYLLLPDGIYELILHCYENDSVQGYIDLNKKYMKIGKIFKETVIEFLEAISHKVTERNGVDLSDIQNITSNPLPWSRIAMNGYDKEYFSFTGWIALPELNSHEAQSFISFTDITGKTQTYTTYSYESDELEQEIGMSNMNNGFFIAYIPLSDFEPGEYVMQLIVQYPEMTKKPEAKYLVNISAEKKVSFHVIPK